jgi:CO/xanthine dehydrogenase FAD-binding subunit
MAVSANRSPARLAAASDTYARPSRLGDALRLLAARPHTVVAGGTDVYPRLIGRPLAGAALDITGLAALRGIADEGEHLRIGALTTWAALAEAVLPPGLHALQAAARQIGGVQIQNAGTIGGNLCNASPAADGVPALLIADAVVELQSAAGSRRVDLKDFILGNRRTACRPEELLTAIIVPKRPQRHASIFLKLGARAYQVISIAMVAALLEVDDDGRVADAAIAVGSCSETAQRLAALEAALAGASLGAGPLARLAGPEHVSALTPIGDVRASAAYRTDAALTLIRRALTNLQEGLA